MWVSFIDSDGTALGLHPSGGIITGLCLNSTESSTRWHPFGIERNYNPSLFILFERDVALGTV